MTLRRDLLQALRNLAEHPATPKTEAENALRRIAEIEAKHPEARRDRGRPDAEGFFPDFFNGVVIDFADWIARQVDDEIMNGGRRGPAGWRVHVATPEDFCRATGAQPFHRNRRPYVEDVHEYGGTNIPPRPFIRGAWIGDAWKEWKRGRADGPLGAVARFEVYRDESSAHTVVAWPCPVCGMKTTYLLDAAMLSYADTEPAARERIRNELFTRLNGDSDNRCARCTRNSGVEGVGK